MKLASEPISVRIVAELGGISETQARTYLEDLTSRALTNDNHEEHYYLSPLAKVFLHRKNPAALRYVSEQLASRAHVLVRDNGSERHAPFRELEAQWVLLSAALPVVAEMDNDRLQGFCAGIHMFLNYSGRWDEWLAMELRAEIRASEANDFRNAGWRAYRAGWIYSLLRQSAQVLMAAARAQNYWSGLQDNVIEHAQAIRLQSLGLKIDKDYVNAKLALEKSLALLRGLPQETKELAMALNGLGEIERACGRYELATTAYNDAAAVARRIEYKCR